MLGTPTQFQAAWKHIHRMAAAAHLNAGTGGRLRWAMILMHTLVAAAHMHALGASLTGDPLDAEQLWAFCLGGLTVPPGGTRRSPRFRR